MKEHLTEGVSTKEEEEAGLFMEKGLDTHPKCAQK